jgi:phytoene dehydrogenase-like protein
VDLHLPAPVAVPLRGSCDPGRHVPGAEEPSVELRGRDACDHGTLGAIVRESGGDLRTDAEVEKILVADGRATAVRLTDGEVLQAMRAVIAGVTPTQLYGRLLAEGEVPAQVREAAARYRYGLAGMQIHIAMKEPPRWKGDERLARTAIVHVTPGLDGVSRAVNEATRGLLPAEATIVCGQPMAVDPSRGPEDGWIVWIQLQELPQRPTGDAAGELDVGDGSWTETLREAYADRIVARLGQHIENLESASLGRVALSPADLAALDVNLEHGDIYAGACTLDQNLLWRPLPQTPGHDTPVDRLYHIGASTHPGPGLGAGSGYLVAKKLTRPALPQRVLARVRR